MWKGDNNISMNIYFDTEFTGLHKNTTLISIGLISEDDKTFYAELNDYDKSQVDDWIQENVIDNLKYNKKELNEIASVNGNNIFRSRIVGNKDEIKEGLNEWLSQFDSVELISDVCHYDMILFIDLFRNAFHIPNNVCPCCYDINQDISIYYNITLQEAFDKSREEILKENNIKINGDKHNSLYDAKVIKEIYKCIYVKEKK